jgi:hypothetical protein
MADEELLSFRLDLDSIDFVDKAEKAIDKVKELGEEHHLKGLLSGLEKIAPILGGAMAIIFSFKESLDLTLEAEGIQKINKQFEILTKQAGVNTDVLKAGLDEVGLGLVDNTDLMQTANKALVSLGSAGDQIPKIMEIARKASQVYGGDTISVFNDIIRAVEGGNTRILKQYGLYFDAEKAVKSFAKEQNLAVDSINLAGKQQAILNGLLEAGQTRLKGIDVDLTTATSNMQLLKTTMNEFGEVTALTFDKIFGNAVRASLTGLNSLASAMKETLVITLGSDADSASEKMNIVKKQIRETTKEFEELQKKADFFGKDDLVAKTSSRLISLKMQLDAMEEAEKAAMTASEKAELAAKEKIKTDQEAATVSKKKYEDDALKAKAKLAYEKELININKESIAASIAGVKKLSDIDTIATKQKTLNATEYKNKRAALEQATFADGKQKTQLLAQLDIAYKEGETARDKALYEQKKKALDAYVNNSTNAFEGITRAAESMGIQATHDMQEFGKFGTIAMTSLQNHTQSAFETMGDSIAKGADIATAAADAMKSVFLNMIADYAEAWAKVLIAQGIGSWNPIAIAQGVGLFAIAGALRGLAGGTGTTAAGAVGGGVGTSGGVGVPVTITSSSAEFNPAIHAAASAGAAIAIDKMKETKSEVEPTITGPATSTEIAQAAIAQQEVLPSNTATPDMQQNPTLSRSVVVNIAGNLFNTSETQRTIVELIRQETDATDFTYNKIGVK